jgi:hypothetical protein
MAETATYERTSLESETKQLRLLTEVEHLSVSMLDDGSIPENIRQDVKTNLKTAVYELSMPLAVSITAHKVEYLEKEDGARTPVITWLGRNAVENAIGGRSFHWSEPALKRVDVEIAEARHSQESLKSGVAEVFISPKMTRHDASVEVAKSEHLHDDDSLRVSYAITNSEGTVVARRLESLLVRDVPIEAWVNMLSDPNNIFGKSLEIDNKDSALSVMQLFDQLQLPEDLMPEGPVTLVEAVLPYVLDEADHSSVAEQLEGFRSEQVKYMEQAEKTAEEWLDFEIELAKSLKNGTATFDIERFIVRMQHKWNRDNLKVINAHHFNDHGHMMTKELAAVLESAKRQTLNANAGLLTGNKNLIKQVNANDLRDLVTANKNLRVYIANGMPQDLINTMQMAIERKIADLNVKVKGGCAGEIAQNFEQPGENVLGQPTDIESSSDKKDWKWKIGKCQVKTCPSPNPTEVGPCKVCRSCQAKFDKGEDPTKPSFATSVLSGITKAVKKQKTTPKLVLAA